MRFFLWKKLGLMAMSGIMSSIEVSLEALILLTCNSNIMMVSYIRGVNTCFSLIVVVDNLLPITQKDTDLHQSSVTCIYNTNLWSILAYKLFLALITFKHSWIMCFALVQWSRALIYIFRAWLQKCKITWYRSVISHVTRFRNTRHIALLWKL